MGIFLKSMLSKCFSVDFDTKVWLNAMSFDCRDAFYVKKNYSSHRLEGIDWNRT